jgi:hypothetical protein
MNDLLLKPENRVTEEDADISLRGFWNRRIRTRRMAA